MMPLDADYLFELRDLHISISRLASAIELLARSVNPTEAKKQQPYGII